MSSVPSFVFLAFILTLVATSIFRTSQKVIQAIYFKMLPLAWFVHLAYGAYLALNKTDNLAWTGILYVAAGTVWFFIWRREVKSQLQRRLLEQVSRSETFVRNGMVFFRRTYTADEVDLLGEDGLLRQHRSVLILRREVEPTTVSSTQWWDQGVYHVIAYARVSG